MNTQACCIPQLDDENNEFFGAMTALGLSCRIRGDIREDPLAKLYCLNCDPQQPQYLRPTMAINVNADTSNITNIEGMGNITYANDKETVIEGGKLNHVLISKSWAASEFGIDPILTGPNDRFAKCGLLVSSPCQGFDTTGNAATLDDRDRYTCGDDLYIPPEAFKVIDSDDGSVAVYDSFETMLNTPDLGTPQIDGLYYFKLVSDAVCTDSEAAASTAPDCLRTATQMMNTHITSVTADVSTWGAATTFQDLLCNIDCAAQTCTKEILGRTTATETQQSIMCCCYPMYDELAFNSGSIAMPSIAVSVLLACLASLLLA
jgi:hypothetical protein